MIVNLEYTTIISRFKEKEPKPQVSGGRLISVGGTKKPNDNKSLSLIFVPPEMTERSARFNVQWTLKEREPKPQVSGGRLISVGGTKKPNDNKSLSFASTSGGNPRLTTLTLVSRAGNPHSRRNWIFI